MADEYAPIEAPDSEQTPPEEESALEDAEEEPQISESAPATTEDRSPWQAARVAAVVMGAVVAITAVIVGAVWAVSAIVNDDDDYYGDCCVVDHATSLDRGGSHGAQRGWVPQPDRDWDERAERRRGERFDRDRGERSNRYWGEWAERNKRGADKERDGSRKADRSEPDKADAVEGCMTILSFGTGDDAVTVLVCNAPRAVGPEFDPGGDGGYFEFRRFPRGAFPFFPFPDLRGERLPFEGREWPFDDWPSGPGMMPWDRDGRPLEGGERPFEYGWQFGDGAAPLDREDWPFENLRPFDREQFEEFFGEGRTLDQLSEEEREQLERMMEMLDGLGLADLLDGILDSLDGLELEFPESQTDPSGVTGG